MYTSGWQAMRLVRVLLAPLAAAWLFGHTATLVAVPALLWATADPIECTCVHGDHAICPMHHKRSARPALCAMQDTGGGSPAAMTPVPGPLGVVPLVVALAFQNDTAPHAPFSADAFSLRPVPPDPPPPRA